MALKQRKDPFYFLIAICTAIFVYFLFYNFSDNQVVIADAVHLEESKGPITQGYSDSIRKIADRNANTERMGLKPKARPRVPASSHSTIDDD